MRPPLLLALFLALPFTLRAADDEAVAHPGPTVRTLSGVVSEKKAERIIPSEETAKLLSSLGWKVEEDGALIRPEGPQKSRVGPPILEQGGFVWKKGDILYGGSLYPLEKNRAAAILAGLANFNEAASMDAKTVGESLAGWGIPPSHDGWQILNPDGSAAYPGLMLYQFFVRNPDALKNLSSERLSSALEFFDSGFTYAFTKSAAHTGHVEVQRAWSLLARPPREGETSLHLKPYPDLGKSLDKYRKTLELAIAQEQGGSTGDTVAANGKKRQALETLNQLEKQRYGRTLATPPPPADAPEKKGSEEPEKTSLSAGLPVLLDALDRVNGTPLTPQQQESLIRSFPMGDLVYRVGVKDLWKRGLTGKGVKVAVIDGGVAPHPELDDVVKSKENFTQYSGAEMADKHGTHVSGIIHQLAPEAEIRSYAVMPSGNRDFKFEDAGVEDLADAIKKAVADGNHIINMSLHWGKADPSNPIAKLVEEYSQQGVIFVIAAGNERDKGVNAPSNAASAISVGSLDANGRMSDFSTTGAVYDAKKSLYAVKDVFMAHGGNILSTVPGGYDRDSGTSMASPATTGVAALLRQAAVEAAAFTPLPDPVSTSQRVRDSLSAGKRIPRNALPPSADIDQDFIIVDPMAALKKLESAQNSVVLK